MPNVFVTTRTFHFDAPVNGKRRREEATGRGDGKRRREEATGRGDGKRRREEAGGIEKVESSERPPVSD